MYAQLQTRRSACPGKSQSKLAELRRPIKIGVHQAGRGEVQPFNEETTARVKARGRSRLNAKNGSGQA
jgi:hypothetical protein